MNYKDMLKLEKQVIKDNDSIIDERTISAYIAVYGLDMMDWDKFIKQWEKNQRESKNK